MKNNTTLIFAAAAVLGSQTSHLSAKEAEVEVRRAISGRNAQSVTSTSATTTDVRRGRGADDATTEIRQARGADDTAVEIRRAQGADDATTDMRQARGADDAATDNRRARGADDASATASHQHRSRGADDVAVTSSGALVPTAAALSAPAPTVPQTQGLDDKVSFGASPQAGQTAGLVPVAEHRSQGGHHILDVRVTGFDKIPGAGTADLENGEIIGNLPNKQRLRFALYANAEQAQAAAALWAAPAGQDQRTDGAVAAAETGIITWDATSSIADDSASHGKGSINGLFLHSGRMPELSREHLRGKVIQIYGPQVTVSDDSGKPLSYSRQVYWASEPIR